MMIFIAARDFTATKQNIDKLWNSMMVINICINLLVSSKLISFIIVKYESQLFFKSSLQI